MDIATLLAFAVRNQASDLHLCAGLAPLLRVHGAIRRINLQPLEAAQLQQALHAVMPSALHRRHAAGADCDFSFALPTLGRFRVHAFHQQRGPAAAIRCLGQQPPSLSELAAPPLCAELALRPRGLVLVSGPTGAGKSSTLAAMVRHINEMRPVHILTIEDPIEFIHEPRRALVTQREIGTHVADFAQALRAALREDPDVLLVGELRDADTIGLALTAAETGHLVLGTLHAASAAKTVDRIIDVFPAGEKEAARALLAEALEGVIAQTLLPTVDGLGRVAAHELLVATPAVRNLIREGRNAQLVSVMQAGGAQAMQTLEASLAALVRQGRISEQTARAQGATG
ncbi:Tfp pilus assembly protein, pilus retraction ATPase PilT protein [Herbaspirillum rubrisubalbicans M1]|uniref:type IV pilus twitching motility protein PilT n=1 Tax=Herbaspirillum rubrisubalbicans TaxID=80842 RepID=UPI00073A3676|nr:PilT/PilU family type 4a pilus ATPase [Herbaspirillum rubrisubalbicans]ALU90931.1 Tfp pilus assembly protein, pilus retraction ATPase PilT protein [Herbaspirillum rubrisubalbicans M1]